MDLELSDILLGIPLLVGLVVILYGLAHLAHKYRISRRNVHARESIARSILEMAVIQRSTFRMDFQRKDLGGYKIAGSCADVKRDYIVIDMGSAFVSADWVGEEVLVFFEVSFKRKPSYYQFRTRISSVRRLDAAAQLYLPIPPYLDPGQKRSFLRVTPDKASVLGLGLWPLTGATPLPTSVEGVPPATVNFRPGQAEVVTLENISAGGMRVVFNKSHPAPKELSLEKGSQMLCLLLLKPMEGSKPLIFWFTAVITMDAEDTDHSHHVGVRFTNWAQMDTGKKNFFWFPIDKGEGAAPLAAWVMRHHLEQSKRL